MRISGVTYVPGKSHKLKRIIITVLILLLVAGLAAIIYSSIIGWNIIHPKREGIDAISSNIAPEFEDLTFKSADKETLLSGWFFKAKGSTRTVIIAHGYGSNRLPFQKQTFDMIKALINQDYNVFTFDFSNSGNSGGNKTTLGYNEKKDLLAAIARVKVSGSKTIVLMGFSEGASTSIITGAESRDVSAVIADSPFSDLYEYLSTTKSIGPVRLPPFPLSEGVALSLEAMAGIKMDGVSPISELRQFAPKPLLLIHGKDDRIISCKNSEELYNAYSRMKGAETELWEVNGAGHMGAFVKSPSDYMEKVLDFLNENVK